MKAASTAAAVEQLQRIKIEINVEFVELRSFFSVHKSLARALVKTTKLIKMHRQTERESKRKLRVFLFLSYFPIKKEKILKVPS